MINLEILYRDENFLIINKPAGLLIHWARVTNSKPKVSEEPTLVEWLLKRYPEIRGVGDDPEIRPGIVHRLDRDTSGVMIIARNQKTFEYFKNQFQAHKIKKVYLALVRGKLTPQSGVIRIPIGLKSGTTKRTVSLKNAKMVKEAVTKYRVEKYFRDFTLLEAEPLTGRTHQIRVHLASIGHPIVGDQMYGKPTLKKVAEAPFLKRHFLHAKSLEFTAPDGGRLKFEAGLPEDLRRVLRAVKSDSSQFGER